METSQRTRKRKYQDTIFSEAEEGHGDRAWEVLCDYVVDPAASQAREETSGAFPLPEKAFPSAFLKLKTYVLCWKTYPSAPICVL